MGNDNKEEPTEPETKINNKKESMGDNNKKELTGASKLSSDTKQDLKIKSDLEKLDNQFSIDSYYKS